MIMERLKSTVFLIILYYKEQQTPQGLVFVAKFLSVLGVEVGKAFYRPRRCWAGSNPGGQYSTGKAWRQEKPWHVQRAHREADAAIIEISRQGTAGEEPRRVCVLVKELGLCLVRNGEGF